MKKGELKKPVAKKPVINKKLHLSHKYLFFFFIAVFVIIVSIPFLVWGGFWQEQYRINHGFSLVIQRMGNSKIYTVTNNSDKDYLIPNRTAAEITSFANNKPPLVTMTENTSPPPPTGECSDTAFVCGYDCNYHGETYETRVVGNQCWFNEDLRATTTPELAAIPLWVAGTSIYAPGPYNKYTENIDGSEYDLLYQWAAALPGGGVPAGFGLTGQQGICPTGWRIPSDTDFMQFKNTLIANNPSCQIDYCIPYNCYQSLINFTYQGFRTNGVGQQWWRVGSLHNVLTSAWDQASNPHWSANIMVFQNSGADCYSPSNNEQTAFSVRCIQDFSSGALIH